MVKRRKEEGGKLGLPQNGQLASFCFVFLLFFTFQLASFKDRSWEGEVYQTRMAYLLEQGQIEMQEPKK